ncbi:MAG TPA: hypothetical protein VFV34_18660, partial [Blastocatellia bacterium]|nr:hypothetical protein [Blastocatellia bacterium]
MNARLRRITISLALVVAIVSAYASGALATAGQSRRAGRVSSRPAERAPIGWGAVPAIIARIKPPKFPARDFNIADYGAAAGGLDCTDAFRKAITACNAAGGGRVVVPPGVFETGAIHLKSNVNLYVSDG